MAIERAGGQHADHAMRLVVEQQVAAEDAGIAAEILLPCGVAQDDDAIRAGLVFFRPERPPDDRLQPEYREVIPRDVTAVAA